MSSTWLAHDSPVSGTRFFWGLRAWNSDPELYRKTSVISPVESRVLTMLSPSAPPGRCCTWTVMSGFLAWKASARPCAGLVLPSLLSTRKVSVVPPPLSLEPRLPELQGPSARMQVPVAAKSETGRHLLANLMRTSQGGTTAGAVREFACLNRFSPRFVLA